MKARIAVKGADFAQGKSKRTNEVVGDERDKPGQAKFAASRQLLTPQLRCCALAGTNTSKPLDSAKLRAVEGRQSPDVCCKEEVPTEEQHGYSPYFALNMPFMRPHRLGLPVCCAGGMSVCPCLSPCAASV